VTVVVKEGGVGAAAIKVGASMIMLVSGKERLKCLTQVGFAVTAITRRWEQYAEQG
jgi:hypothetical protein